MSRAMKAMGIECPIIREGDDITTIVVNEVLGAVASEENTLKLLGRCGIKNIYAPGFIPKYYINNKDIIGITESVIARAAGQYVTVDEIAADIEKKFGKEASITLVNPIYSRNRFSMILKGIARAAKKLNIVMPSQDEVGNPNRVNRFTGVNIEDYYKEICKNENCEVEIYYSICYSSEIYNNLIYCGLHDYSNWKSHNGFGRLSNKFTLADICSDKSPDWGLLGTNKATDERLKLFPSIAECKRVCDEVKLLIKDITNKDVVVCVYGDGCFKDPVGGIWEFADPVTMPYYTDKELMESSPKEIKIKTIIDNLSEDSDVENAIKNAPKGVNVMNSMGTTPRIYRDLLASTMDLISGSGDRCTPVVLVQNCFSHD